MRKRWSGDVETFDEGIGPKIKAELKQNQLSVDYWVTVASLIEKQEPDPRKKSAIARDFRIASAGRSLGSAHLAGTLWGSL